MALPSSFQRNKASVLITCWPWRKSKTVLTFQTFWKENRGLEGADDSSNIRSPGRTQSKSPLWDSSRYWFLLWIHGQWERLEMLEHMAGWGPYSSCGSLEPEDIVSHLVHFTIQVSGLVSLVFEFQARWNSVLLPLTSSSSKHAQHLYLPQRLRIFKTHNSILIQSKPKAKLKRTVGNSTGDRRGVWMWLKEKVHLSSSTPSPGSSAVPVWVGFFWLLVSLEMSPIGKEAKKMW